MGFHIQLDLKAIEQAAAASGAEGIGLREHLAGLVLMYHHVWAKKSDQATVPLLMGWFGVPSSQVARLVDGLVAFEHLAPIDGQSAVWRIKGARRYESLRAKLSAGGHASKGNLRQFAQTPASTSSSQSGPEALSTPASGKTRSLSDQEECWDNMERSRVEHCERLGLQVGKCTRPKLCNKKLNDAVEAAGIADDVIIGGQHLTKWDYLTLLFDQYLLDELGRVDERKGGVLREPPWPIPLFLSPNVLERFKRNYEAAA